MSSNRQDHASPSEEINYSESETAALINYLNQHSNLSKYGVFADMTPRHVSAVRDELLQRAAPLATDILYATPAVRLNKEYCAHRWFYSEGYYATKDPNNVTTLKALEILKKDPDLLFIENIIATSPTGIRCQGSPIQLILGTGDVWLLKETHDNIFARHQEGANGAQALFKKHFDAQFPHYQNPITLDHVKTAAPDLVFNGYEEHCFEDENCFYDQRNIEQIIAVKRAIMAVTKAICADSCNNNLPNQDTQACIDVLRAILTPDDQIIIKTGLHFPSLILLIAVRAANDIKSYSNSRMYIYLRLVLGSVQKYATPVQRQWLTDDNKRIRTDGVFPNSLNRQQSINFVDDKHDGPPIIIAHELGETAFIGLNTGFLHRYNSQSEQFDSFDITSVTGIKLRFAHRDFDLDIGSSSFTHIEMSIYYVMCKQKRMIIQNLYTGQDKAEPSVAFKPRQLDTDTRKNKPY